MAEQLIVLGNGFDLACGLKSSYSDFFKWLYKKGGKSNRFEKEEIISGNFWMLLFWELHNCYNNWADVESEIEKTLIFLDEDKGESENNYENCDRLFSKIRNYSNFEASIPKSSTAIQKACMLKLYGRNKEKRPNMQKGKFWKEILLDLNEFENQFKKYINTISEEDFNYYTKANQLFDKIRSQESNKTALDLPAINLFTFNYTTPMCGEYAYAATNINDPYNLESYNNVHGVAYGEESKIIFGIDNKNYDSSDLQYPFTKTFRTLVMYSDLRIQENPYPTNIFDKNINVIKFYGHSLAEADYSYFQALFDYYDLYNNNELRLYFYFSTHGNKTSQEMILEQAGIVTKLIEKYGETLDNKNHGKNLLTRLIQTKRLFIKEI